MNFGKPFSCLLSINIKPWMVVSLVEWSSTRLLRMSYLSNREVGKLPIRSFNFCICILSPKLFCFMVLSCMKICMKIRCFLMQVLFKTVPLLNNYKIASQSTHKLLKHQIYPLLKTVLSFSKTSPNSFTPSKSMGLQEITGLCQNRLVVFFNIIPY